MIQRICDFCEKKNPDYTIKCKKTNHRIMFNHDWESVDICEECYNKLFGKDKIEIQKSFENIGRAIRNGFELGLKGEKDD